MFKLADAPVTPCIWYQVPSLSVGVLLRGVDEWAAMHASLRAWRLCSRNRAAPLHVSLWKLTRHAHAFLQVHASKQEMAEV